MSKKIGFIGVGVMGKPMVANLAEAGHEVTAYDRSAAALRAGAELGAAAAGSAAEAARGAEVVITMLPSPVETEEVVMGPEGALAGMSPGTILVDMGTTGPAMSRKNAEAAARIGVRTLDAPVSGGQIGAEKGTLAIMVGGDEADFNACREIFNAMGNPEAVVHVGGCGMGQVMKLVNNIIAAAINAVTCEALVLGVKAGLDLETMVRVVSASSGNSWVLSQLPNKALLGNFDPGFSVDLMHKDVGLALAAAADLKVALPVSATVRELFGMLRAQGKGRRDTGSVLTFYEELAGVDARLAR